MDGEIGVREEFFFFFSFFKVLSVLVLYAVSMSRIFLKVENCLGQAVYR